jgi:hypothetical protein
MMLVGTKMPLRLCLVPRDELVDSMQSVAEIADAFRSAFLQYRDDQFHIYGIDRRVYESFVDDGIWDAHDAIARTFIPSLWPNEIAFYFREPFGLSETKHFKHHISTFQNLATKAALFLSPQALDDLTPATISDPIGLWIAAITRFASDKPRRGWQYAYSDQDLDGGDGAWTWMNPFGGSIEVMQRTGLVGVTGVTIEGEWSIPMTRSQIARKVLGRTNARARDIEILISGWQTQSAGGYKVSVRLDTLPLSTRRKLES